MSLAKRLAHGVVFDGWDPEPHPAVRAFLNETVLPRIEEAIKAALDEAAKVARQYGEQSLDDFEGGAAFDIANQIEALK